jgi:hypothetical protein
MRATKSKINLALGSQFVAGATAAPAPNTDKKLKQITVTFSPSMLAQIDALAKKRGMSRAALIKTACSQCLERGEV